PPAAIAGVPLVGARRLKPFPGKVDTVKVVFLNRCRLLSCYEVKASACSESHSKAHTNVRISHPLLTYEIDLGRKNRETLHERIPIYNTVPSKIGSCKFYAYTFQLFLI